MKAIGPLAAVLACSCATSTDRAAALRDEYRSRQLAPELISKCRSSPPTCGGYAGTYWTMPLGDVVRATGCVWSGQVCVSARERYVFRSGALTGVLVPYSSYAAGRAELAASLGEPGWEGSNTEGFESRIAQAATRSHGTMAFAALGSGTFFGLLPGAVFAIYSAYKAREEVKALVAKKEATVAMRCSAWNAGLTRVILCEEDGKSTRALFTSRAEPETSTRVGDFAAPR